METFITTFEKNSLNAKICVVGRGALADAVIEIFLDEFDPIALAASPPTEKHSGEVEDYQIQFFGKYNLVVNTLETNDSRKYVELMCSEAKVAMVECGTADVDGQVDSIEAAQNAPSDPKKCIEWAKNMFKQLIGGQKAVNNNPKTIFNQSFCDDMKHVLGKVAASFADHDLEKKEPSTSMYLESQPLQGASPLGLLDLLAQSVASTYGIRVNAPTDHLNIEHPTNRNTPSDSSSD